MIDRPARGASQPKVVQGGREGLVGEGERRGGVDRHGWGMRVVDCLWSKALVLEIVLGCMGERKDILLKARPSYTPRIWRTIAHWLAGQCTITAQRSASAAAGMTSADNKNTLLFRG